MLLILTIISIAIALEDVSLKAFDLQSFTVNLINSTILDQKIDLGEGFIFLEDSEANIIQMVSWRRSMPSEQIASVLFEQQMGKVVSRATLKITL